MALVRTRDSSDCCGKSTAVSMTRLCTSRSARRSLDSSWPTRIGAPPAASGFSSPQTCSHDHGSSPDRTRHIGRAVKCRSDMSL